jgi:nitroreductase
LEPESESILGEVRLIEALKARRSIRKWEDRDVADDVLVRAIELATWAPSGGNQQAWRFYVVKDRELISKMADAVQAATEEMASWPEAEPYRDTVERWRKTSSFFRSAPACIAVFSGIYQSIADRLVAARGSADPLAREVATARQLGASRVQSVGAAIAYLLLILRAQGVGSCWMTGPLQAKSRLEALLDGPTGFDLMALVPVGYPAESPAPPARKPVEDVVKIIR